MASRTIFLAKLIGLFCVLVSLSMLINTQATMEFIGTVAQNHSLLMIVGMIGIAGGLALVLGHNVWSGGPLPVVVTLFGWLMLVRGVMHLFAPAGMLADLYAANHLEQFIEIPLGVTFVLGLYLSYAGFTAPLRQMR